MDWTLVFIFFGACIGGYFGYRIHRKYRLVDDFDDDRIGEMVHISDALDGYLEKKVGNLKM